MCISEIANTVFRSIIGAVLGFVFASVVLLAFLFIVGSILMANI